MQRIIGKREKYYFPDKLKKQLHRIPEYPLTIVEAPSGFGKTTAVREYLRNELSQAACEWYTCVGESASVAWAGICEMFSRINSEAADGMKDLKTLTMDTLFHMTSYLKTLKCRKKTYFVIDNYHLMSFNMHRELLSVFSLHESPNLHMIFITQQLDSRQQFSLYNNNIHTIDASSFFFDREGISTLFRMEGLRLTESELESVFENTEGWISAIRLQLIHYKETGSFVCPAGIEALVETAVWNRLSPTEKDFLLAVSVFESFTARQAAGMLDYEVMPGQIEAELRASDFIRFLPDKRLFIIHSILLDYLRNRFYYHQPKEYQNRVFYKAGGSCAAMGQYCLAAEFFYKIRDFGAILSLPFTREYLDAQKGECEEELFAAILRECPEDILCEHPSTMIVFAHCALLSGQYALYEKLRGLLFSLLQGKTTLAREEIRRLTGELVLLEALGDFNDLSKMYAGYRAASEILGESPELAESGTPWLSVFPTAFGMFWREPGKLDETLGLADLLKPIFRKLSRGQGAGFSFLMRAEALLFRGEDSEAEILCYKAIYEARAFHQLGIALYAELCLARIFILRGDAEHFFAAMGNIEGYAAEHSNLSVRRMADICMSVLSLLLGVKDYVAPWLSNIGEIRKSLYAPAVPFAEIIYCGLLLIDKRYSELYAVSELALDTLRSPGARTRYVMPQLYFLIFLAAAKHGSGDALQAQRYLKEALNLALLDRIYLPFADHDCMEVLLSGVNLSHLDKELPGAAPAAALPSLGERGVPSSLLEICRRQQKGLSVIRKALFQNKSPLTPREREIALLAKKRMSAKEIADKLYISEATVKTTLRNVYSKLEIHSRGELAAAEF